MEKELVMFLIGAGASRPMGIPTMKKFTGIFESTITTEPVLYSYYNKIKEKVNAEEMDIEELLVTLRRILSIGGDMAFDLLNLRYSEQYQYFVKNDRYYYETILGRLLNFIRQKCIDYDRNMALDLYKPLLDLSREKKLHLFTTNYDSIIEDACVELHLDFEDGFVVHPRGGSIWDSERLGSSENINIYKLHGSISWYQDMRNNEIFKEPRDLGETKNIRDMTIYPGEIKDDFHYPYDDLFSEFVRILFSVKRCYVIGSSLRDRYLCDFLNVRLKQGNFTLALISPNADRIKSAVFEKDKNVVSLNSGFEEYVKDIGFIHLKVEEKVALGQK
ncbi:MAG: SIR2 family protein [Candidatus Methanofastidiosia archaeon]